MCIQTLCVSTAFGGTLARVEQHCSPELCVCVYQEVERVHFGLVMFAEGQSGLVPKTSQ